MTEPGPPQPGDDVAAAGARQEQAAAATAGSGQPNTTDPTAGQGQAATDIAAKQFEFARDAVTQVLTLSTALLAISLTFSHDWAAGSSEGDTWWLRTSWILLLFAIVGGLWALLALTGVAYKRGADVGESSFRRPWLLQVVAFLLGLVALFVFGMVTVNDEPGTKPGTPTPSKGP